MKKTLILLCAVLLMSAFFMHIAKAAVPLADLIEYAGHGKLYNIERKEIPASALGSIQDAMLEMVKSDPSVAKDAAALKEVAEALTLAQSQKTPLEAKIFLRNAAVHRLLRDASQQLKQRYDWRNDVLIDEHIRRYPSYLTQLAPGVINIMRRLGFFRVYKDTGYMSLCRSEGVPVPPDWSQTGTEWVYQGQLEDNLLDGNSPLIYAGVWTWSDPAQRGACIALPRGIGGRGSLAGIICQSATTGKACFWDNKLRSDPMQAPIGWDGLTLVISELRDGSNLRQNCTGCHTGNNVFLMAPADPTWVKVLRGPLDGPRTGTFTTRVETSTDNTGGHPRYVPISGSPPNPLWRNTLRPGGCGGDCHENAAHIRRPVEMPPMCALGPSGVEGCYGTP